MSYSKELAAAAETLRRRRVYAALVIHDDRCQRPDGSECTCNAEIEIRLVRMEE